MTVRFLFFLLHTYSVNLYCSQVPTFTSSVTPLPHNMHFLSLFCSLSFLLHPPHLSSQLFFLFLSLYLSFSLSLYFYHFTFLFSFRPLPPIHLSYYSTMKGIGALAGSTIMLLTIPWCLSIIGGRVDIDPKTKLARYVYHHSSSYFSLLQTTSLFYVFFYCLRIE